MGCWTSTSKTDNTSIAKVGPKERESIHAYKGILGESKPRNPKQFNNKKGSMPGPAFDSDGPYFLCGDEVGQLKQFDIKNDELVKDYGMVHHGSIWTIAITNDKRFAYTTDQAGLMKQWDLKLKLLWRDWGKIHKDAINCIHLTRDDKIMFTCDDSGSLKKWSVDLLNLNLEKDDFTEEAIPILSLTTSNDIQHMFYGDKSGSLYKWGIESQTLITQQPAVLNGGVFGLEITKDNM